MKNNDAIYGFGVLGAAIYFVQTAQGFWMCLVGILKAIVWPAFLLYKVLEMMKV